MDQALAYGVYGLAFFTLGVAVAARASAFATSPLQSRLYLFASFSVLHGVYEWLTLARIHAPDWAAHEAILGFGAAAFAPLLYFALIELGWPLRRIHALVGAAAIIWLAGAAGLERAGLEALTRWGWAGPITVCAASAMLEGREFRRLKAVEPNGVRLLAWAMGAYAFMQFFTAQADFFPTSLINAANFQTWFGIAPLVPRTVIAFATLGIVLTLLNRMGAAQASELEARAAANEASLRAILDAEPECVKVLDANGALLDMNPAGLAMIGAGRLAEISGASVYGLIKPEYHDAYCAALNAAFRGERTTTRFEIVGLNGVHRHMEQHAAPLSAPGKAREVERIVAVTRDITEQVKAEAKLRQSARMLERAQTIASMGCWEWDIRTNDLVWSDEIYRIFGLAPAQFAASYPAFLERVHPDDRTMVEESVRAAVYDNAVYNIRHRIVRPDGEVRMVREQGEVESDSAGRPLRMLGVVQDISAMFEIEQQLRLSEERLAGILNIAPEAVIVTDSAGIITMFSAGAEHIFGHSARDVIGRNVACLMPHRFRAQHDDHIRGFRNAPTASKRMSERAAIVGVRKNGEEFPAQASISRLVTPKGVVFTTILRDITAERAAHQDLLDAKEDADIATEVAREAAQRLEEAQRIANVGSWEWRPDTYTFTCSEQTLRILGRTRADLARLPKDAVLAPHPDDAAMLAQALHASLETGVATDLLHRIVRPDGEVRVVRTQAQALKKETDRVVRLVGVTHDLTELRPALHTSPASAAA